MLQPFLAIRNPIIFVFSLLLGIGVGVMSVHFSTRPAALAMGLLLIVVVILSMIDSTLSVGIVLAWIAVQNVMIPALYTTSQASPSFWTTLLAMSQISAVLIVLFRFFAYGMTSRQGFPSWTPVALLYSASVLTMMLGHKSGSLFIAANSARQLLVPILFIMLGSTIPNRDIVIRRLLKLVAVLTFIGGILAIVDASMLSSKFWVNLSLGDYWIQVKHVPPSATANGLPLNFFEIYGGTVLRRAISIYGDPLAAGYSMALGFGAILFLYDRSVRAKRYLIALMVVLVAVALTFTRAAYIMVLVEMSAYYLYRRSQNRPMPKYILVLAVAPFLLFGWKVIHSTLNGTNSSAAVHMQSFYYLPFLASHPMGVGVGTLGGPEGAYLGAWFQFGVLPLLLLLGLLKSVFKSIRQGGSKWQVHLGCGILISLAVSGLISAEMLTDTACSIGWVIVGMLANTTSSIKKKEPFSNHTVLRRAIFLNRGVS